MKKIAIFFALFLWLSSIPCYALIQQSKDIYVTDSANILSQETEDYILEYSKFLWKEEGIQYYVVTTKNLEGIDFDEYVQYVWNSFFLDQKGILIFFSKEERSLKILTGEALGDIIDDEVILEYINTYFMPYLQNYDFDKGIKNGYSAFYKLLCHYYDIDSSSMEVFNGEDFLTKYEYPILFVIIWICTTFSYVFWRYFKKIYGHFEISFLGHFLFGVTLFFNILLLLFAFWMRPLYVVAVLCFELIGIFGNVFLIPKKSYRRKTKRKLS